MTLSLRKAEEADCRTIHRIQVKAFAPLLMVYRDYESSPAAESLDRVIRRFRQNFTDYYLICLDEEPIGTLRVCDFGENCWISPLCVLPEYQGRGYAQRAMAMAETLYPKARRWALETIEQEAKLCHLYEKLGYRRTGDRKQLREGMDLVCYEKGV